MTDRERLIELIETARKEMKKEEFSCDLARNSFIAEYLITNGVKIPVLCRDCVHAVEIEKDYIRNLFIDGTKQCELGRGDPCFGYPIISNDGFCDSGERRADNAAD